MRGRKGVKEIPYPGKRGRGGGKNANPFLPMYLQTVRDTAMRFWDIVHESERYLSSCHMSQNYSSHCYGLRFQS